MSDLPTESSDEEATVLIIPRDVDLHQLKAYVEGTGPLPDRSYLEPFDVWTARGRVADCDCQLLQCVCAVARPHKADCRFRIALTCAVPITCDHGVDVCPECDPCTCGEKT